MWLLGSGCGYRPAYGAARSEARYAVVPAQPLVGDLGAVEAALGGAREELATTGLLGHGAEYPRIVIELVRIDDSARGIAEAGDSARARGTAVTVVGHAWLEAEAGAPPARDTGDLERTEVVAPEADPRFEGERHREAVQAAATRLGRALAQRVLGHPTALSDEG